MILTITIKLSIDIFYPLEVLEMNTVKLIFRFLQKDYFNTK